MGKIAGAIALTVAGLFALLLILAIWGIYPISFLNFARLGATGIILSLLAVFSFIIFGMFFWKGNERKLPTSSKEKEEMRGNRANHG